MHGFVNERRIEDSVLRWFGHIERMENSRITNKVHEEEYMD